MKKIILTILCSLFIICCISINYISAEELVSDTVVNIKDIDEYEIMGGGVVYKKSADTYYNGNLDSSTYGNQTLFGLKPQTYQWVDMSNCSDEIKTVVWSKGDSGKFESTQTTAIAKNYEDTHPGWIVVSALSGDWFAINDTQEATNLMVQDGEVLKPFAFNDPDRNVLGWKENGELIVGNPTFDNYMSAHIYTDLNTYTENYRNELNDLNVVGYNCAPSETGITVYTKDVKTTYDLTGYTVYIGQYDLCRQESYTYKPFVKGEIKQIVNNLTVTKPVEINKSESVREFFLVCKDGSLDGKLSIGNYVKCQFDLNGEWTDVAYSCGFINQVLKDGESLWGNATGTYGFYDEKTACKPRGVIGFKEDGSVVIMDIDGRDEVHGHTGLSCYEAGELMRLAGCVNAYNLDGGGSATLVVRNEYNGFDIVNIPSDGREREIGNAILFVMRDPGVSWDIKNTSRDAVSFTIEETKYSGLINNLEIEINGNKSVLQDSKYIVSGLKEDTEYEAKITYSIPSHIDPSVLTEVSYKMNVKTKAFQMPSSGLQFTNISKNSATLIKRESETSSWITNVMVDLNGFEYVLGSKNELVITDLIEDTEYIANITYDVVDPITNNVYKGNTTITFETLSYELPVIEKFEIARQTSNRITFTYSYSDIDKLVKEAYIYCNKEAYKLSTKSGTLNITDLDFNNNVYTFYMLLLYDNGSLTLKKLQSEKIEINSVAIKYMINYELDGGTLPNDAPASYTEGEGLYILPKPTKEGYNFVGWTKDGEIVTSISMHHTGDVTLVATWEQIEVDDPGSSSSGCKMGASVKMLFNLTTILSLMVVSLRKKK